MENDGRFVLALYCDDVRQEVGHKLTLVGVYGADLLLNALPTVLAKLAVYVRLFTPVGRPFQKLTMRVRMNEQLIGELEFSADQMLPVASQALSDARWQVAQAAMFLSPLLIPGPGFLKVETETEEGILDGPKLVIRQTDSVESGILPNLT